MKGVFGSGELTLREILAFGLGGLLAMAGLNNGIVQARMVPSGSMAPTFVVGDRLMLSAIGAEKSRFKRGEILVFRPPFRTFPGDTPVIQSPWGIAEDLSYIKRCVGLPGDLIEVKSGQGLFLDGKRQAEPYILEKPTYNWGPARVPAGRLFMLGDNRNNSFDSHYWGFLPLDRVLGRPTAVIWPPRRWQKL